ncbi:5,6-dimethylbenzimidazole synthase [Caldalkalibacillus mannanilyticus]|uniref:5,6-dimethylbenzimidazole synthase n=1 Tax=Caldalkalibacillus mannanilyticus TaxID=1418 RepID=UPI00054EDBA2|nr:5,6-dimethylbenzimidazole synthase [Caldalkalibacillus mannanilyticus]
MLNKEEREGVYKAIKGRRDIRSFLPDPISPEKLENILKAAHHGPSVGYMQPWDFIIITSAEQKKALAKICEKEVKALAIHYEDEKKTKFLSLKLEGIQEAPVTICITCDPTRGGNHVLGRNSIPETDILSVACGIQNMWLSAYAEGIAMGWVSFYKKADVRELLKIPYHIDPIALVSLGYTEHYPARPILEEEKWEKKRPFEDTLHYGEW